MVEVRWTDKAVSDLAQLHQFLAPVNPRAAAQVVRSLAGAPDRLIVHPRLGERLEEFSPREVRRIFVGNYEMRYELAEEAIYVLRLWHAREDRN